MIKRLGGEDLFNLVCDNCLQTNDVIGETDPLFEDGKYNIVKIQCPNCNIKSVWAEIKE